MWAEGFVLERSRVQERYRKDGLLEIGDFTYEWGVNIRDLFTLGLVKEKYMCVSTRMYDFELTPKGRRFIKSDVKYILFLVKDEKKFLKFLKKNGVKTSEIRSTSRLEEIAEIEEQKKNLKL